MTTIESWRASTRGRQVTRTAAAKQRLRVRNFNAADRTVSSRIAMEAEGTSTEAAEIHLGLSAAEASPADGLYWASVVETFRLPARARASLVALIEQVFPGAQFEIRHRIQAEREPEEYAAVAVYVQGLPAEEVLDREEDLATRFGDAHPELVDRVVTRAVYR